MNAPIQCLSATAPFARFFTGAWFWLFSVKTADVGWLVEGRWKTAINYTNKLGSQGRLAGAFAKLLHEMWGGDLPFISPTDFRVSFVPPSALFALWC
jgi:ubiquitin carboxyl-terminal hydrolase 8